jgi:hypothetical protein
LPAAFGSTTTSAFCGTGAARAAKMSTFAP